MIVSRDSLYLDMTKEARVSLLAISACIGLFMISVWALGFYFHLSDYVALTRLTKEDGQLEWLGFLLLFHAFLMLVFTVIVRLKEGSFQLNKVSFWVAACLMGLFFLAAGEEISWGQRLTGHASADFFRENNAQSETNFHNLKVGDVHLNKLVFGKFLFVCLLIHNLVLPLWVRKKPSLQLKLKSLGVWIPPLNLVFVFLGVAVLVGVIEHPRHKEILEVCGVAHYYTCVFLYYFLGYGNPSPLLATTTSQVRAKYYFILQFFVLVFLSWVLSLGVRTMEL